jgi:integrase
LKDRRAKGLANSTLNKDLQFCISLSRFAVKKGYRAVGFAPDDVKRQKHAQRRVRVRPELEQALIAGAYRLLQWLIIAAIELTARRGGLLKLRRCDIDLNRNEVRFRAETTKDHETRILPISKRLRAVLEMALAQKDPDGADFKPETPVFCDELGRSIGTVKTAWHSALKKAKAALLNSGACESAAALDDVRFHDLRHEGACRLAERGVPLHLVSAMLGHANLKTTSIYVHGEVRDLHAAFAKMENLELEGMFVPTSLAQQTSTLANDSVN